MSKMRKCNARRRYQFHISHINFKRDFPVMLPVDDDCVFGRRKWKLLQIMASTLALALASSSHSPNAQTKTKAKKTSGWFQVNEYNTLSIISVRQTPNSALNAKLNDFSGYFDMMQKKMPAEWRSTDSISYAACFISSQFVSSMQAKCIAKWNGGKSKRKTISTE